MSNLVSVTAFKLQYIEYMLGIYQFASYDSLQHNYLVHSTVTYYRRVKENTGPYGLFPRIFYRPKIKFVKRYVKLSLEVVKLVN